VAYENLSRNLQWSSQIELKIRCHYAARYWMSSDRNDDRITIILLLVVSRLTFKALKAKRCIVLWYSVLANFTCNNDNENYYSNVKRYLQSATHKIQFYRNSYHDTFFNSSSSSELYILIEILTLCSFFCSHIELSSQRRKWCYIDLFLLNYTIWK